jgi:hypothetical protein
MKKIFLVPRTQPKPCAPAVPIWLFPHSLPCRFLSNTMFDKIDPRNIFSERTIPQANGFGDVVAWGPHLHVRLRRQNCEFATPRAEKPPTEHTTINTTTIQKRYLINHLISTMLSGQYFVFLFHQGTERPHQGNMNTRAAIPNTTKEVRC